jgi:hypothetical protein
VQPSTTIAKAEEPLRLIASAVELPELFVSVKSCEAMSPALTVP